MSKSLVAHGRANKQPEPEESIEKEREKEAKKDIVVACVIRAFVAVESMSEFQMRFFKKPRINLTEIWWYILSPDCRNNTVSPEG